MISCLEDDLETPPPEVLVIAGAEKPFKSLFSAPDSYHNPHCVGHHLQNNSKVT